MKNKKMLGNFLLLLTAMIWGTAFVFQRMGMDSVEPFTFTAARMFLAALAAGAASLFFSGKGKLSDRERREKNRATLLGGLGCGVFLTAASLFQQVGMVTTTAGKAGFITALYILLVPVLNYILFKKRSGLHVWLAIAAGLVGMYLLCMTEGFRLTRGDALVCACAVVFSGHILCADHFAPRGDPVRMSAIQFLVVSLTSLVLALIFETPSWASLRAAAVPILYCGVMSGGVGYTLQMVAQGFTDPTVASLLMSMESVFAVLGGVLLLHERMSGRELLGCVVMFTAIVLVQLPAPHRKEQAE